MQRKNITNVNDESAIAQVLDGAFIGGAVGVMHTGFTVSTLIGTEIVSLTFNPMVESCRSALGADTAAGTLCTVFEWGLAGAKFGVQTLSLLNIGLDFLIASCATALGVPELSNVPVVDIGAKVALVGAAVGAGYSTLRLFTKQDNQVEEKSKQYLAPDRDRTCSLR